MLLPQITLVLLPVVLALPSIQQLLPGGSSRLYDTETSGAIAPVEPLKVAVIGSGIVGASAAFTLAENARQNSRAPPLSITIFEQNAVVGGRITTTQVFGETELTIDTCAATFSMAQDICVDTLAREVGSMTSFLQAMDNGTAIWNGKQIVGLIEDEGFRDRQTWSNFKRARFQLRYGTTPFRVGSDLEAFYSSLATTRFKSLEAEVSIGKVIDSLVTGACEGTDVLCNGEPGSDTYLREIIEAGVRDRFFGDYDQLNELNSVLGLSDQQYLLSIDGGNLRLIERLIRLSSARLLLSTQIRSVLPAADGRWNLAAYMTGNRRMYFETFDKVIIAAPLSLSDIQIPKGDIAVPQLQFVDTVVTHFTTKWNLKATYFGTGLPVPQNILTSATATDDGNRAEPPFFSLRLLDNFIRPVGSNIDDDESVQKLYKIVSHRNISLTEILEYLEPRDSKDAHQPPITWMNREYLPRSVPRLDRTLKIQGEIEIQPGLFYAGGGAQVTDTIEFGCRMGRNAARLIIDDPVRYQPGNG